MPRRQIEADLREAGFSSRTIHALVWIADIRNLDDLRSAPWGSGEPGDDGLWRRLAVTPNFGRKSLAEVVAYREGRHPSAGRPAGPVTVSTLLHPAQLAQLDAWIASQPQPVTRSEAVRSFILAGLEG